VDFLLEWLIQAIIEIVVQILGQLAVEAAFEGIAHALASRIGRLAIGCGAGLIFGAFWGDHLNGHAHWPRLLWVSLALAVGAAALAIGRHDEPEAVHSRWRSLFVPPWRWPSDRFVGLTLINIGVAVGIVTTFRPGGG
jgi:hypothetical protein